jgi:hypothetical protein
MVRFPGKNDAPDAEDDSKTTTPKTAVSDNVIEPNDSDPDDDDLTVSKVNGKPIDSDGVSTIYDYVAVWRGGDDQHGRRLHVRPQRSVLV